MIGSSIFKVWWLNIETLEAQSSNIGGSKSGLWRVQSYYIKSKVLFNVQQITTAHVPRNTLLVTFMVAYVLLWCQLELDKKLNFI
jgi:hypothetical protein